MLEESGHPTAADGIRYEARNRERALYPMLSGVRLRETALWMFVGYGFRPEWALYWLFGIWLVGSSVYRVQRTPSGETMSWSDAGWFSLHTMTPSDVVPVKRRPKEDGWLSAVRLAQSLLAATLLPLAGRMGDRHHRVTPPRHASAGPRRGAQDIGRVRLAPSLCSWSAGSW